MLRRGSPSYMIPCIHVLITIIIHNISLTINITRNRIEHTSLTRSLNLLFILYKHSLSTRSLVMSNSYLKTPRYIT